MTSTESNLSLGEFLRHERERRGITVEQVAAVTKIGVKTLHLLEGDHYAELPARPFIRGFVASYCRFVGLDSQETLNRFDGFIDQRSKDRPNRDGGHSGYVFEKRDGDQQSRMLLVAVLGGFMVVGGVIGLVLKPSLNNRRKDHVQRLKAANAPAAASPLPLPSSAASSVAAPTGAVAAAPPKPQASPAAVSAKPSPVPSVAKAPAASGAEAPETDEAPAADDPLDSGKGLPRAEIKEKVILTALADVGVRYQCDDRPVHHFVLKKGKVLVLRGKDSVRLQVSNPKAVTVNYNGTGTRTMAQDKKLVSRQETVTAFYPGELSESIDEPFPGAAPLQKTPDPVTEDSSPDSDVEE